MIDEKIQSFISALGEEGHISGDWVRCSCPLAFSKHQSGKDTNPSFGISRGNKVAIGNCFSCGFSAPLEELLGTLIYESQFKKPKKKIDYKAAYDLVNSEDEDLYFEPLPDYEAVIEDDEFIAFPEWWLNSFIDAAKIKKALDYLTDTRGMSLKEIKEYELKWDSSREMVCFPFRDSSGHLAGMRGRSVNTKDFHDYKYKKHSNTRVCWYGEHKCDFTQPIVVCEGQFDYLKIRRFYPNVLAGLTASLPKARLRKLEYSPHIIGFWDNDKAGKEASEACAKYLDANQVLYTQVDYLAIGGKDKDDPDKLTDEQVEQALQVCLNTVDFSGVW